jgi:hypothetical protein
VQQRCRCRLASLGGPVDGDSVDEGLVVGLVLAGCDGCRLAVSFRDEFRGPYVGHPDLNRSEALGAQTLAMFADTLSCASHTAMLHVTNANLQPSRWWIRYRDGRRSARHDCAGWPAANFAFDSLGG